MANCAIVGINWGDEGKDRMVDLLTRDYEVVVRFQGGGNAGHELSEHIADIDYECVSQRENEVRHDVMAHVYAYGQVAPTAAGIIHLGATSCYVTDNADLIIYRDALTYLRSEL